MNFFDLHCDTISHSYNKNKNLSNGDLHVNFEKVLKFKKYYSCFAIWIDDIFNEDESFKIFNNLYNHFDENKKYVNDNTNIILSLEGTKPIGDDLSRIKYLKEKGIKIITLTWNGRCRIGDGCCVENSQGLSDFGKNAVKEMQKNEIIVDVSHASEKLFYDVCEISSAPIIATHSNSKYIFNHVRNLSDDQFKIIVKNKGLVGINFCDKFLSDKTPGLDDVFKHIDHFLSLSGENSVCFGTDFDGCDPIEDLNDVTKIDILYNYLLKKNYSESLVNKLFFDNAYNFFN